MKTRTTDGGVAHFLNERRKTLCEASSGREGSATTGHELRATIGCDAVQASDYAAQEFVFA